MDDYIKRDDAFNIKNYLKRFGCFGDSGFVEIEGVLIALSKIPSADVAPVRHGRWENYKDEHRCSVCGEVVCGDWSKDDYEGDWFDYCPNCGAKMEDE